MPGLLLNEDTHHDSTTVPNPSSSGDEHTNGNIHLDFFGLPPAEDGRFNLALADVDDPENFITLRNNAIGMTLEYLDGLTFRIFRGRDPDIYDAHFHYSRSCIGPLLAQNFEPQVLLQFATENTTALVYVHFFQVDDEGNPIAWFPRTEESIQRGIRRGRSGQVTQNGSGSQ